MLLLLALSIAATTTSVAYAEYGKAKVKLLGGIPGARVRINGRSIGTLPLRHAATVKAGIVEIEVEKEGFETFRHSINIASGSRERVWVDLESYPEDSSEAVAAASPIPTAADPSATTPSYGTDATASNTRTASVFALLDQPSVRATSSPDTDYFGEEKDPSPTKPALEERKKPDDPSENKTQHRATKPPSGQTHKTTVRPLPAGKEPMQKRTTFEPSDRNRAMEPQPGTDEPFAGLQYNNERSFDDYEEVEDEEKDIFDPLLFELFTGYSYLLLALGTRPIPDSAEVANLSEQEAQQLASTGIEDWVDIAQGGGVTVGTALSLRIDFISFGARLSYSSYSEADVLVFMGEIAQRIQGSVAELYVGFGFGGGWLYRVPDERITQDSGLALRFGLGLSFFIARGWTIGIGADAIGLFLGGNGVSPSQVGDISLTEANHPVGLQVPITFNISPRL